MLQLARLKADLSQREQAERVGVPVTMISAYERAPAVAVGTFIACSPMS